MHRRRTCSGQRQDKHSESHNEPEFSKSFEVDSRCSTASYISFAKGSEPDDLMGSKVC